MYVYYVKIEPERQEPVLFLKGGVCDSVIAETSRECTRRFFLYHESIHPLVYKPMAVQRYIQCYPVDSLPIVSYIYRTHFRSCFLFYILLPSGRHYVSFGSYILLNQTICKVSVLILYYIMFQ